MPVVFLLFGGIKEHQTDDGQAFRGNGKLTPEQEEIRKLKAKVKSLEMENQMAIWQRKPKEGLIVHSDRGSQYANKEYRRLLKSHNFVGSMSRKGNCWDTLWPKASLVH